MKPYVYFAGCGILALLGACPLLAAPTYVDDLVVSNSLTQTDATATNTLVGHLVVEGDLNVESALRVPRQGDVEMGSFTNGSPVGGASGAGGGTTNVYAVTPSYIYGCWADYSNATSVVISVGEGFSNGSYFLLTNETVVTISGVSDDVVYYYIDDSNSTYPNGIAFTFSTNAPSYDASLLGWYLGADRMVSAALVDSNGSLRTFDRSESGTYKFKDWAWTTTKVLSGGNPSGTWQATGRAVSTLVPSNARVAHLWICSSDNAPDTAHIAAAAAEFADDTTAQMEGAREYAYVSTSVTLELGPSCNVKWIADDNDWDGYCTIWLTGWRVMR